MESNFLRKFVSLFEGTEVPERFATWAGLSCISAMLERRIWIDMNIFTIYPNMYVIFVADSGRMRKSTAIKMTHKLLGDTDPGPRIVAQKITPEALIDALKIVHTSNPRSKEPVLETCGGIVIADELVTFLNKDTYERGLGSLLITLWDCPDTFEYRTRNRPVEEITFGHLSLLGGTTIHTLREALPIQALGDGFSSRVLFIYVDETPIPVPRPVQSPHFRRTAELLTLHLRKLATLSGSVKLSPAAEEFFDNEYRRFFAGDFYDDGQFQAYASRRDKHLLKVAMCLMAAEDQSMIIEPVHLIGAKVLLEDIEQHFNTVFERITMTETGSLIEKVYTKIRTSDEGMITRADLLKYFSHKINAMEMGKVTETLVASGRVNPITFQGKLYYKVI